MWKRKIVQEIAGDPLKYNQSIKVEEWEGNEGGKQ